jgi:divalent metal cation (Fe/Co/Zn/Cd) transporter
LLADVWTPIGVLAGFVMVVITGLAWLDAVVALGVALHITLTGWRLVQRSAAGLLDQALGPKAEASIKQVLDRHRSEKIDLHALRTRRAGQRAFVSLHVVDDFAFDPCLQARAPSSQSRSAGRDKLSSASVITHIEPNDDPGDFTDENEP